MSLVIEALRDAAICTGLLLALPVGYCVLAVARAVWKEVRGGCRGNDC